MQTFLLIMQPVVKKHWYVVVYLLLFVLTPISHWAPWKVDARPKCQKNSWTPHGPASLLQRVFSSAAVYGRVCFCLVHAFSRHLRHLIPIAAMLPEVARIAPSLILPPAKLLKGGRDIDKCRRRREGEGGEGRSKSSSFELLLPTLQL